MVECANCNCTIENVNRSTAKSFCTPMKYDNSVTVIQAVTDICNLHEKSLTILKSVKIEQYFCGNCAEWLELAGSHRTEFLEKSEKESILFKVTKGARDFDSELLQNANFKACLNCTSETKSKGHKLKACAYPGAKLTIKELLQDCFALRISRKCDQISVTCVDCKKSLVFMHHYLHSFLKKTHCDSLLFRLFMNNCKVVDVIETETRRTRHKEYSQEKKSDGYKCGRCTKLFSFKALLLAHFFQKHKNPRMRGRDEKNEGHNDDDDECKTVSNLLVCGVCSYKTLGIESYQSHMFHHTAEKRYTCSEENCDFATAYDKVMELHTRVHTKMMFKCLETSCPYANVRLNKVVVHERTNHPGLKLKKNVKRKLTRMDDVDVGKIKSREQSSKRTEITVFEKYGLKECFVKLVGIDDRDGLQDQAIVADSEENTVDKPADACILGLDSCFEPSNSKSVLGIVKEELPGDEEDLAALVMSESFQVDEFVESKPVLKFEVNEFTSSRGGALSLSEAEFQHSIVKQEDPNSDKDSSGDDAESSDWSPPDDVDSDYSNESDYDEVAHRSRPVPKSKHGRKMAKDVSNNNLTRVSKTKLGTASKTDSKSDAATVSFLCYYCVERFENRESLMEHVRKHHTDKIESCKTDSASKGPVSFICEECGETFKSKLILQAHEARHNEDESKRDKTEKKNTFHCNKRGCEFMANCKSDLLDHLYHHTKRWKCTVPGCGFGTTVPWRLRRHEMAKHKKVSDESKPVKQYACPHCDKVLSTRFILTVHLRSHNGERPFKCSQCNYSTNTKENLSRHLITHPGTEGQSGIAIHKCLICPYTSSESGKLKRHMQSHVKKQKQTTGLKKY